MPSVKQPHQMLYQSVIKYTLLIEMYRLYLIFDRLKDNYDKNQSNTRALHND